MKERPLGRRKPTDLVHIQRYPFAAAVPVAKVERTLPLPYWHWNHDQGSEGACVGFGLSMVMSIKNEMQARELHKRPYSHRYDALWLYYEAQRVDEWPGEDYDGTSVRAGCDVLRLIGHRPIKGKTILDPDPGQGIAANRWAMSVDDIRTAIAGGNPVAIGVNWYSKFDRPDKLTNGEYVVAAVAPQHWGALRGGHCACIYGASDRRSAFAIKNSWGA